MKVAISQRVDYIDSRKEIRDALDQRIINWILKIGFTPIPIPNTLANMNCLYSEQLRVFDLLDGMNINAILLTGGNDIGSSLIRDMLEKSLLSWAEKKKKPVLGICRGMQMMGVYGGVKLTSVVAHNKNNHRLIINKENSQTYPSIVNSYHNYALETCPDHFEIIAKAEDGTLEAIRHKNLPWEGWMWHPERDDDFDKKIMNKVKNLFKN